MSDEFDVVARVTSLYAVHTYCIAVCRVAGLTAIEVVHGERGVRRDLVQALAVADCLLYRVLIIEDLIA